MYEMLTEIAPLYTLTLPAKDFAEIQAKLGLTDAELGARIFRGPCGPERIRQFRTGETEVSPEIAVLMCGFERAFDGAAIAA